MTWDDDHKLALVAARSLNGVIGKDGGLPWHIPEDLRHFKRVTLGHAILMGRKTFDSIRRPLPDRRNIVISRQKGLVIEGCEVFPSLEAAIAAARQHDDEPRVVGGASIYRLALPLCTKLILSEVQQEIEGGDVFFPRFGETEWQETKRVEGDGVIYRTLERLRA